MTIKMIKAVGAFLLFLTSVATVTVVQGQVLDNGLVQLSFNPHMGTFAARSASMPEVHLFDAGPHFEIDGRTVSAADATKIDVRRELFTDQLGHGDKLVVTYSFNKATSLRYELCLYAGKSWISVTGHLSPGDYHLSDFSVVQGKVETTAAFKTRVYINSGYAGGDSGVWPLGEKLRHSDQLSEIYDSNLHEAVNFGFYSFYRASTSVDTQYLSRNEVSINAVAHYHGYVPPKGIRSESLLISFGTDPLRLLENWVGAAVKVVQPRFHHDTVLGSVEPWYIFGDQTTQHGILAQAKMLSKTPLPKYYGIKIISTGEWQVQQHRPGDEADALGFGEDQVDKKLFPHGLKWLCDQILALGFEPDLGANYAYAAPDSNIAEEHVPWIDWSDDSRSNYGHPIDFTDPRAQKWLYNLAHHAQEYRAVKWWDDFDGGPTRGTLHDPTKIMGFEDIREGIKTIRSAIGPKMLLERSCCGPYFTYVGLADRVRIGDDSHALGDFAGLMATARQLAANYMLQQHFWINNPDVLFLGGRNLRDMGTGPLGLDSAMLHEIRMRLQYQVSTGSYIRLGENFKDLGPKRIHLLTLVLPSYGQAARPVDMFVHTTPEIYDLPVNTDWGKWHVLMLQNWNEHPKTYHIHFAELRLNADKPYLVFSFWDQWFLGEFRNAVRLNVGAHEGEAYAIRNVPNHPWILSTDMHLTQGGAEIHRVRYDANANQLSGIASRNPGAQGHVVVYVPSGYRIESASGPYTARTVDSGATIIHLDLKFQTRNAAWSLKFKKSDVDSDSVVPAPKSGSKLS